MPTKIDDSDRLYTRDEAAELLGISRVVLLRGELTDRRLRPVWLKRQAYYTPPLLAEWRRHLEGVRA